MPCSSTIFKRSQQRRHTYTCAVSPEQSEVDDPVVQLRPSPSRTCETKYEIAEVKWNKRLDRLHRQQTTRLESVRSPQLTWTQQLQSGSLRLSSDWLRVKHLSVYISRPCQSCCRTEECKKSPHTSGSVCASETQFVRLKAWNTRSSEACQGYFTVSRILSVLNIVNTDLNNTQPQMNWQQKLTESSERNSGGVRMFVHYYTAVCFPPSSSWSAAASPTTPTSWALSSRRRTEAFCRPAAAGPTAPPAARLRPSAAVWRWDTEDKTQTTKETRTGRKQSWRLDERFSSHGGCFTLT